MTAGVNTFFSYVYALEREAKISDSVSLTLLESEVAAGELKARWEDVKVAHHEVSLEPVGDGEGALSNDIRAAVDDKLDACYQVFVKGSARLREGSSMSQRLHSTELPREEQTAMGIENRGATGQQGTVRNGWHQEAPGMGSAVQTHLIPAGTSAQGASGPEQSVNQYGQRRRAIRLAPVDTEPFNGNYVAWPAFRDLFTALYINHPDLSDVERMVYLRSKTRGDALELIEGLPVMAGSFERAWSSLCTHYENPRALVTRQLQQLLSLPPVQEGDLGGLKTLQRAVNNCVTTFGVLKLSGEDFQNAVVTHLCGSKLPSRELDLWEFSLSDQKVIPAWSSMNSFLSQRCGALFAVSQSGGAAEAVGGSDSFEQSIRARRVNQVDGRTCRLCSGQRHLLNTCPRFRRMSVRDRMGIVRRHQLCRNCLAPGHWAGECTSGGTCQQCGSRHHTLMHGVPTPASGLHARPAIEPAAGEDPHPANGQEEQAGGNVDDIPNRVVNRLASVKNGVILGTALVVVTGPFGKTTVRALIDSGSEATLITQRIQARLSLRTSPLNVQVTGVNSVVSAHVSKVCCFTLG